ncbi:hypothetical protein [Psychromonas sp. SP041]|uniref:hypothetical protein n=1 Tax=Psychromonas sp. SP041 TaxID=1365007 RepID=UPI0004036FD1|nr:hypothetical protein [Psychromonas sp. SP041]
MITTNYKTIAAKQFQNMNVSYPGSFYRGNYSETPMAIANWIKALVSSGVQEDEITPFVQYMINSCQRTKNIGPKPNEIEDIYREFKAIYSKVEKEQLSELDISIERAYRYLSFKYERLFKGEFFTKEEHFKLWFDDLKISGASSLGIDRAVKEIKVSTEFGQYPPNVGQFTMMSIAYTIDEKMPMASDALNIAVANKSLAGFHPIISHVRAIIGYENLTQNTRYKAKSFEKEYQNALMQVFKGELDLSSQSQVAEGLSRAPELSNDDVANGIWGILNS